MRDMSSKRFMRMLSSVSFSFLHPLSQRSEPSIGCQPQPFSLYLETRMGRSGTEKVCQATPPKKTIRQKKNADEEKRTKKHAERNKPPEESSIPKVKKSRGRPSLSQTKKRIEKKIMALQSHPVPSYTATTLLKVSKELHVRFPDLFAELHEELNPDLKLKELLMDSSLRVQWKCSFCAKTFVKSIVERVYLTKICPHCAEAQRKPLDQHYPQIASEWHPLRNFLWLKPCFLECESTEAIWWRCKKCQFDFEATPKSRCAGESCPRCHPVHGNWALRHPEIAKEWHPLRNGDLRVTDLNDRFNKLVWWMCQRCSFEYEAGLRDRINKNVGCPLCDHNQPRSISDEMAEEGMKPEMRGETRSPDA